MITVVRKPEGTFVQASGGQDSRWLEEEFRTLNVHGRGELAKFDIGGKPAWLVTQGTARTIVEHAQTDIVDVTIKHRGW